MSITWREQQRHHLLGASVSALIFDSTEDLLWAGGTNGQMTSYLYPGNSQPLIRYTSFPAHTAAVSNIISTEHGIYSVGFENVRVTNRRGVMTWNKL